ncbi:MFS transporter [Streptomyces noursei]
MSFVDVHLVASLDSHGLGGGTASTTMAILGAAEIVGSLVAGYLCDRGHGLKVLAGCYLIRALSLVVMVVAPTVLTAWVFGLLFGISYLGTVVAGSMYLLNALDPRAKGLALGMMWCLHQVGAFAASEAGGLSFDALHSYDPIVIGAAASAGLSFLIVVLALPKALRKANPTHA